MKAKDEKEKLTEREIDERVIAEAEDQNAWVEVLRKRAAQGSRAKFDAIMAKVPDVEPDPEDRLG